MVVIAGGPFERESVMSGPLRGPAKVAAPDTRIDLG